MAGLLRDRLIFAVLGALFGLFYGVLLVFALASWMTSPLAARLLMLSSGGFALTGLLSGGWLFDTLFAALIVLWGLLTGTGSYAGRPALTGNGWVGRLFLFGAVSGLVLYFAY
ncbi:hypothetical protein SAMN02745857_01188 [Andreprevotia lacus DSM 23236]|jgi:hypothetical protein|uniref:Uncharacterized protein n=1 Tax=Andreprevotia lacus DSM 23236 TaxID=1121001 RepID=A0A1W1XCB3_9NEIS|nr:hypothetical protein [Andreprevotia lacus]SMC21328.1 hypothetical protein SAMN02745857_01188 [Andreprevotia lacus DSM 23236]